MKVTRDGIEIPLRGPGGEPVDLWRTFISHGVATLPPMHVDETARTFEVTLAMPTGKPRTVVISEAGAGARVAIKGRQPGERTLKAIADKVVHVLRLDEDLSGFYDVAHADPDLSWAVTGAGRMIRCPTVFEEVVKTICTTNCAWSGTVRMVGAIVGELGEPAAGAPDAGPLGRAFPTPEAMASAGEPFYRERAKAGYRGAYLISLASSVADGSVDLEELAIADDISDEEVEQRLLALPGVGPYAAAHIMMMIGRYSRLILDSWSRPAYLRLAKKRSAKDNVIQKRFTRYGAYAGLAFWLFVTKDWVDD